MNTLSEVKAYVRRGAVASLADALAEAGVARLWVGHVHTLGAGIDPEDFRLSFEDGGTYSELARVEFLAPTDEVDALTAVIREHAASGHRGDGIIVTTDPVSAVSVRTGERGRLALI